MPESPTALSLRETQALRRYEVSIEKATDAIGAALFHIRKGKLYRGTHHTFDEYCRERWDMDPSTAHRLAEAYALRSVAQSMAKSEEVKQVLETFASSPAPLREFGPSLVGSPTIEKRAEVLIEFAQSVVDGDTKPTVIGAREFVLANRMPGSNAVTKRGRPAAVTKPNPTLGAFKQGYVEGYKDCARAHELTVNDAEVQQAYRMASGDAPGRPTRRTKAA